MNDDQDRSTSLTQFYHAIPCLRWFFFWLWGEARSGEHWEHLCGWIPPKFRLVHEHMVLGRRAWQQVHPGKEPERGSDSPITQERVEQMLHLFLADESPEARRQQEIVRHKIALYYLRALRRDPAVSIRKPEDTIEKDPSICRYQIEPLWADQQDHQDMVDASGNVVDFFLNHDDGQAGAFPTQPVVTVEIRIPPLLLTEPMVSMLRKATATGLELCKWWVREWVDREKSKTIILYVSAEIPLTAEELKPLVSTPENPDFKDRFRRGSQELYKLVVERLAQQGLVLGPLTVHPWPFHQPKFWVPSLWNYETSSRPRQRRGWRSTKSSTKTIVDCFAAARNDESAGKRVRSTVIFTEQNV